MSFRTALIGAGFISSCHIEALRSGVPDTRITAIVDRNQALAETQARRWGIPHMFGDIEALIAADVADVAHVIVPPEAHATVACRLLDAGFHVLLEKPMATSAMDCQTLLARAAASNRVLGINQNFVFHPAYRKARRILLDERRLGPIRSLHVTFSVPLRQLAAGQFGHWMFRKPVNILLEQAVHPLSQMVDLLGRPTRVASRLEAPLLLTPRMPFQDRWLADFAFEERVAQLYLAFGQNYHAWRFTAICDDGLLVCDMSAGRIMVQGRGQWPEFADDLVTGVRLAGGLARQSIGTAAKHLTGLLKLRPRSDAFFVSMRESIAAFYRGLVSGKAAIDGAFGAELVRICETLAQPLETAATDQTDAPHKTSSTAKPELVVFGGTGFIGSHLVQRLVAEGRPVRVVSRGADANRAPFDSVLVEIMRGDVSSQADVQRAVEGMKQAVNLAHGGGGKDWPEIKRAMVDSALGVAEAADGAGLERLVHVGSIAGLYLGNPADTVTGATPPDADPSRALYARAKAEADRALEAFARTAGLELVLLRPGLVVGKGTPALHGGLGYFNNEQHVIGWNGGSNPLPFVLVDDVVDAILRALVAPEAAGKSYNLVGDVRLTAREFVAALAEATGRPLVFHPQSVDWLYASELFKWTLKRASGKKADSPSKRDLLSRGLRARIDCEDAKRDLGWQPVADVKTFAAAAIEVHRAPFARAQSKSTA